MYFIFHCDLLKWRKGIIQAWAARSIPYQAIKPHWWLAKPLVNPFPHLEFLVNSQAPLLDNFFTGTTLDLYSSRLIEIIRFAGVQFETFPTTVLDVVTRKPLPYEYKLFHLLEIYPSIDWERSKLESEGLSIKKIEKLVLNEKCLSSGKLLFRISEMKGKILIHQDLKAIFDKENIIGCNYIPIEQYQLL